ncbi:MAG: PDZ domain-containing protein [Planctomycetes bacterium]|nr:PDZ domain-containing protein [Planctomycetota bacterium]
MVRAGLCVAAGVLAVVVAWIASAHFPSVEAALPADAPPAPVRADAKGVDLTALRDAVNAAAKKGENVEDIRAALEAFEKTSPQAAAGRVPPELQALRDAVDAAAKKGENVEAITKELVAVEMTVAGRALTKPKPEPQPEPRPNPGRLPRPVVPPGLPFPILPNPGFGGAGGGIDVERFNKAMELRKKAIEMMLKDPNDPAAIKEAEKLQAEALELLMKAARGGAGGGGFGAMPLFPDIGRIPDGRLPERARLGIRLERVPPIATEQLGLEPNTGIAVALVAAGSVAEKAGLKVHDIILEFAGKAVTDDTDEFIRRVNAVKAGGKIDIVVLRKGKKVEMKGVELPEVRGGRVPQPLPGLPKRVEPDKAPANPVPNPFLPVP